MTARLPARYELRRPLGAGGMGEVLLAFDRERGIEVALKRFRPATAAGHAAPASLEAEARWLFKQEFWAMVALAHPNLVAAHDFGELEDGTPYFTMDHVAGDDLAIGERRSEAEVRAWLPGLALALAHLHARGYVHADLKPENVRIAADGTVKLMDLGLLTRAGRAGGPIRGTPAYMAPEAIRQGALDARTDMYALGALVYAAIAGRAPFGTAESAGTAARPGSQGLLALLRAHLSVTPEPLEGVSPTFARAVMRLLAKDPADRFASAGDLLAALGLEGAEGAGAALLGSPPIGRDEARAALAALVQPAARAAGERRTLVLAGGPGSGKSRLLAEARAEAQLVGLRAFEARGTSPDAAPYEALSPWLRALTAEPSPALVRLAPVLVRLVPALGAVPAPTLDGAAERLRLHAAVAELARERAPEALWLLDDADRLDPASAELVRHLREADPPPGWRFAETRAAGEDALALSPLPAGELLAIARALLGQPELPAAVAEALPELAGGAPGNVEAVLGHWVRTGALRREAGRWVAAAGAKLDLPGGLAVALDARFEELSADARLVGRLAGLLGLDLPAAGLLALSGLAEPAFFAAIDALERGEVLRREGGALAFVRPLQGRVLAATWSEQEARGLNDAAADWLAAAEGRGLAPDDPATPLPALLAIARRRLAGRTPAAAAPWALAAARRALDLGAIATADELVGAALPHLTDDAPARLALLRIEAMVRRLQGRGAEAMRLYAEHVVPRLREAGSPRELAEALTGLGIAHQMQGAYAEARTAFREALALADAHGDAAEGARVRLCLGRVAYFKGEPAEAETLLAEAVACARRAGAPKLLAGALGLYGYVLASGGRRDAADQAPDPVARGLAMLDEAVALNRDAGDVVEAHETLNLRGNVLLAAGRLAEAEAAFAGCRELAERTGMLAELTFGLLNLGAVALERGQAEAARTHGEQALALARRQGRKFPEGFALALTGLAMVESGEHAAGLAALDEGLALARAIQNRYLELHVAAYRLDALLRLGRHAEAEGALAEARALAEASKSAEHDVHFARLEAELAAARGAPDAEAKLAAAVAAARAADQKTALARALQARARHDLAEAAGLAAQAGLPEPPGPAAGAPDTTTAARYRELHDMVASVGVATDLADVLDRALRALVAIAGADRGHLLLYEGASLAEQVFLGDARPGDFSASLAFKVFWSEEPIWLEDVSADAELASAHSVQALELRSVLGVPLIVPEGAAGELPIGVMLAESRRIMAGFGEADMALVRELGRQVATIVWRTKRLARLEGENATLALAGELALALLATADRETAFRLAARAALAATGAERALYLEGEDLAPRHAVDAEGRPLAPEAARVSRTVAGWVLERGEPVRIVDAQSDEALADARSVLALGLRTITAAVVGCGDRRFGVLYLDDQRLGEPDPLALDRVARIAALLGAWLARA